MTWLITSAITNALVVIPLAGVAWLIARYGKRPALAHLVWAAVLVKLLTPPIITVPIPWQIDPQALLAKLNARPTSTVVQTTTPPVPLIERPVEKPAAEHGTVVRK